MLVKQKEVSTGGDWSEVGHECDRKGRQGAGHVETYRPGLGDGVYSKCNGKPLGDFQQVSNMI